MHGKCFGYAKRAGVENICKMGERLWYVWAYLRSYDTNVAFLGAGEIVYIHAFGTDLVYLNSRRLTYELFEKRSSIYSDRPSLPMIVDLCVFPSL